jgi:hypothetical protein
VNLLVDAWTMACAQLLFGLAWIYPQNDKFGTTGEVFLTCSTSNVAIRQMAGVAAIVAANNLCGC